MSFLHRTAVLLVVALLALALLPAVAQGGQHLLEERAAPAASTQGTFALVSSFNDGGTYASYGWKVLTGRSPAISSSVNYFGEPSLKIPAGSSVSNSRSVVPGGQFISFQVAVSSPSSTTLFSIVNQAGEQLFTVGVDGAAIYAGTSPASLSSVGNAPSVSAYPANWVYLSGNIYDSSTNKAFSWTAQLFVDGSSSYLATVSVPAAYQYAGVELSVPSGQKAAGYATGVVFSSYEIPIYIPGYNPMEGYGQGSGLLVSNLKPFTILQATMTLDNWNVPEGGILSYQINAMNYYGATRSSCVGFFQLGVDLNPNGHISPWYVPGKNCFAHYFLHSNNPAVQPGFLTPQGSKLQLSIVDSPANKTITFSIVDLGVSTSSGNRYWNATIPYNGTDFYASYTQLEFQPSSSYPISQYYFNGSMSGLSYGSTPSKLSPLNEDYMLPFTLNAPPGWSFTYYNNQTAGYRQIA